MAKIKLADACLWLNDRYDAEIAYQQLYMYGLQRRIRVERDPTGRFWEIDEDNLPAIAKTLGLTKKPQPASKPKPTAKPTAKPAKPAPNRPARSRAARSAA
jgi:hypothetical protein